MPRGYKPQVIGSVVGICVLVGSFAWVPTLLNFGFDELGVRVELRSSEVAALRKVREESGEGDVIATNHHSIESIPSRPERSYGYRALSERPVLLEGWQYGERFHKRYSEIKKDNEVIFNSKNCMEVNEVLKKHDVKYIIQDEQSKLKCDSIEIVKLENTKGKTKIYKVIL
jgi:uncharacterized membrane protein